MGDPQRVHSQAHLSLDGKYRYTLERRWGPGDLALFVMLNPSTADATVDDQTIRKCKGFARLWVLDGIRVVNLYAYRATSPHDLREPADPEGAVDNDRAIRESVHGCSRIICAWGAWPGPHTGRPRRVYDLLIEALQPAPLLEALGLTNRGCPRHPLYAPYNDTTVPFTMKESQ